MSSGLRPTGEQQLVCSRACAQVVAPRSALQLLLTTATPGERPFAFPVPFCLPAASLIPGDSRALVPAGPALESFHHTSPPRAPPHSPTPCCSPARCSAPTAPALPAQSLPPGSTSNPVAQNSSPAAGCLRGAPATVATLSTPHSSDRTNPAETAPPLLLLPHPGCSPPPPAHL